MEAETARSISEFVRFVMEWTAEGKRPVAFRGQAFDWSTKPKLFRDDVGMYDFEKKAVRDLVSIHPQEFRDDQTMFDRLVRMQHFELPTRLLDVTTNPLVALYFASARHLEDGDEQDGKVQAFFVPENRQRYYDSDRVSLLANLANLTPMEKSRLNRVVNFERADFNDTEVVQKLISFVRIEKPGFEPKIDPTDIKLPVFVKPKMSNRRIIAQSGAFIIYGSKNVSRTDREMLRERVVIPAEKKEEIRDQLERLGIHAGTLFPEIDKAAEYIVRRYTNGQ